MPPIGGFVPVALGAPVNIATPVARRSSATGTEPRFFGFLGPYRRPNVPALFPGNGSRLASLVHDGKLYLTAHDAIALAIENNLDVEVERYNLQLAATDTLRARGGGSLRGIDYTVQEMPNGVGGPGSPLLNTTAVNSNPVSPSVTDLTSLNSTGQVTTSLSSATAAGGSYSAGPAVPLFDPSLIAQTGYFRRVNTVSLLSTAGGAGGGTGTGATTNQPGALNYVIANVAYLQGFRTGAQVEASVNNNAQAIYGSNSGYDPFSRPSTFVTATQPLLRGFGSAVNLRYLRISNLNREVSTLLFEQQLLETVYGISRLYYDLVSLGENVAVKAESLRAAEKLRDDDQAQVDLGTLAPIELVRATALVSSSQFDLVQAQGLYRQQEVILRNQLVRTGSPVFAASFTEIVPTDHILVPDTLEAFPLAELVQQGLSRRPDLQQSELQIKTGEISVAASRNQALPQLNAYANIETRGSSEQGYEQIGSTGTGLPTVPQNLGLGGLRVSTIYQAGIQLTLPLRNRVATADAARDAIQLRQVQARTERLSNSIRQDIENGTVAVETAFASYRAAVSSRGYQQQLLQADRDRVAFGQGTNLIVVQDEAYLAQARSTEIAARSNYIKARIDLDHALGNLLEKNGIRIDDAIQGTLK